VEPDGTHGYFPASPALRIWRIDSEPSRTELHENAASAVELSEDGARLYIASRSSPGLVARPTAAGTRATLYADPITALGVSRDARRVAIAGMDHVVRVLALPSGRVERSLRGHEAEVVALRFADDSRRLVSAGGDRILVWSL
jgi:WD40 repeat protein